MEKEIWKNIKGYEGLYEISSFGSVRSLCSGKWGKEMIRKLVPDKDGYMTVNLKKNGKYHNYKVHRLVGMAFIDNPNNLPMINHKDENRANNTIENLEWCDCKYNNNYNEKPSKYFKPINRLNEDGTINKQYKSITEASKENAVDMSCIIYVLKGKRKHAGGWKWEYQY